MVYIKKLIFLDLLMFDKNIIQLKLNEYAALFDFINHLEKIDKVTIAGGEKVGDVAFNVVKK